MEPTIQILDEYLEYVYLEEGFKEFLGSLKEKTIDKILNSAKKSKDIDSLKSTFKGMPTMTSDKVSQIAGKRMPEFKKEVDKIRVDDKDPNISEFKKFISMAIAFGKVSLTKVKDATTKTKITKYIKELQKLLDKGQRKAWNYASIVYAVSGITWLYSLVLAVTPAGAFFTTAAAAQVSVATALFLGGWIILFISSLVSYAELIIKSI
jgi:hypothetical protein